MVPTLIVTKYMLPPSAPGQIARDGLVERLLAGLNRKCTLISAPAGFGKSTLAAQLARRSGRQAAWLSLDRGDNDPARFGAYLVEAIRQSGLSMSEQMRSLLRLTEYPPLDTLVATSINAAVAAGMPYLLVLDDYHLIVAEEIHAAIATLLHRLPPNFHVVIATRARPPLPLASLKARGDLSEIAGDDLRFTAQEAAGFLHDTMGLDLPEEGVEALIARTEGWVAGLKLAALSLNGASDWVAAIERFDGRHPDLLNYLVDEVVHQQPEAVQLFLQQTAILDRLTGPLCNAVTGQTDGHQTLQALEQANMFIVPLDPDWRWYRYHPLFAEFLLVRLREAVGESGMMQFHHRAAVWYREKGQLAEAIDHLLAAGGYEDAADCLEAGFADWSSRGSSKTLRQWIDQIPKAVVQERPRLCTMAAWVLINRLGGLADHDFTQALDYLNMASRALRLAGASQADVQESLGILAAVRTALAPWAPRRQGPQCTMQDVAHAVACAEEARELLPEDSLFWRSVTSNALGQVYLRAGDVPGAAQAFGEAGRLGNRSGNLTATVVALHRQAQLLMLLGRPSGADAAYREALRLAAEQGGNSLPTLAPIYLGRGLVQYEWNDLSGAEESLTEARKRYEASGADAPEALLAIARLRQARGDAGVARLLVDRAGELLASRTKLRAAATAVWPDGVRVLLAQGDVAAARRWVRSGGVSIAQEPVLWRAAEYLALARVLTADGQAEAALPLLHRLRTIAVAGGCRGLEAEICLVQAVALHATRDDLAARANVHAALAVIVPDEFVRLFADEGRPIIALLGQINGEIRRGRHADAPYRGYVPRLLAMLTGEQAIPVTLEPPVQTTQTLIEPLTEREREIVRLIASGCSNQDIARELFVGVSTVKWHLLNIYGKLQVQSRTQAVAHARQLGLV